jgi:hypothetical protein
VSSNYMSVTRRHTHGIGKQSTSFRSKRPCPHATPPTRARYRRQTTTTGIARLSSTAALSTFGWQSHATDRHLMA